MEFLTETNVDLPAMKFCCIHLRAIVQEMLKIDVLHGRFKIIKLWLQPHIQIMTHICVSKLNIIGSDNGLSPGLRQAIIWTNADIL